MSKKYLLDVDCFNAMNDIVNIFITGTDHQFLYMNKTCERFLTRVLGIENPLNMTVKDTFLSNQQAINSIIAENELVLKTKKAETFYNVVDLSNHDQIKFLTTKMPIYEKEKLVGIFGIAYYIEQISSLPAYQLGLTDREIDCINLLLENKSYKEIAKQLKLSPRTVESYLQNAKDKLNCESNADLRTKVKQTNIKTTLTENIKISSVHLMDTKLPDIINQIKNRK